jgi:hypothetical protein
MGYPTLENLSGRDELIERLDSASQEREGRPRRIQSLKPAAELAFVATGYGTILFSSAIAAVANKATGQLFYQEKRWVGGQDSTLRNC